MPSLELRADGVLSPPPSAPAAPLSDGRSLLGGPLDVEQGARDWLASNSIVSDPIEGDGIVAGRPENGAPTPPVTGTPIAGAHSEVSATGGNRPTPHRGAKKKKVPRRKRRVPVPKRGKTKVPSAKDLFG